MDERGTSKELRATPALADWQGRSVKAMCTNGRGKNAARNTQEQNLRHDGE